jgi:hypothetical protein
MAANDNLHPDQFGLSSREQAEISGKAMGGHIWDGMEQMMGGPGSFRQSYVTDAWADAHANWQGHNIVASNDDYPEVRHDMGNGFEARYAIGGPYVNIHPTGSDQAIDALHVGDEEDRTPGKVMNRIRDFDPNDYQ